MTASPMELCANHEVDIRISQRARGQFGYYPYSKKVRLRVGEELEWDLHYTAVAYDEQDNAEESGEDSEEDHQGPAMM